MCQLRMPCLQEILLEVFMHAKLGTSGVYSVRLQNRPMHPLTTALVYTHYVLIDPVCVLV